MTFFLLTIAHAILLRTLPCFSVKIHLRFFGKEASGNPIILNGSVSGQNCSFTGCDLSCFASLLSAFTPPIVGQAACSILQPIYLSQKAFVSCMHCRAQWRSSFVFLSTGISSNSSTGLLLANFNVWFWLRIQRPTNSLSCEGHINPVFGDNLDIFAKSDSDALFYFGSTCSEEIICKYLIYSCHGFPWSWTSCNGSQHFLICSIYFCPHTRFTWDVACIVPLCTVILFPGLLTRLY